MPKSKRNYRPSGGLKAMAARHRLLVTGSPASAELGPLLPYARIYRLDELEGGRLDELLPEIDCLFVQAWWPEALDAGRISRMTALRFVQSGLAGVNHIPFGRLGKRVIVSSNAGGFSTGVAEYALALMLSAAKRVVRFDLSMRNSEFDPTQVWRLFQQVTILKGRTLGVLGYGGIGRAVGEMGSALGMNLVAFSRHAPRGVRAYRGRAGLLRVLRESDVVVIALPLSKLTFGLVGRAELAAMKREAILVNVARAEIVDDGAVYEHLLERPEFTYATDVWEIKGGKETYSSRFPFLKLDNFIGTPHVAGGSASVTGAPGRAAVENLARYLRGERPRNVVDPSEYA